MLYHTRMTKVRTIGARAILTVVLFVPSMPGFAAIEECQAAFLAEAWVTALSECRPVAEQGDAAAQYKLGVLYDQDWGVPLDYAEAARWSILAAEQGNAPAQTNLGVLYDYGRGVPRNDAEAARWYAAAANKGHAEGQHNLGLS